MRNLVKGTPVLTLGGWFLANVQGRVVWSGRAGKPGDWGNKVTLVRWDSDGGLAIVPTSELRKIDRRKRTAQPSSPHRTKGTDE